jgi:membrane associated rhomboid family serine protease
MLLPLRDVIRSRTTPVVTWLLIALSAGTHLVLATDDPLVRTVTFETFGLVPAAFSWLSVLTSMFVHGDLLHLGSNMLSLWIFGDNVEDQMGHGRFLLFYLACGTIAALAETWSSPESFLPMVGASGAIAGVMGAYFVMYPHSRVLVLLFLVFYINVIEIPAVFFLAFWFFMQVIGGLGRAAEAASTGGVAFWAHAGGFVAGVLGGRLLRRQERTTWEWRDVERRQ